MNDHKHCEATVDRLCDELAAARREGMIGGLELAVELIGEHMHPDGWTEDVLDAIRAEIERLKKEA